MTSVENITSLMAEEEKIRREKSKTFLLEKDKGRIIEENTISLCLLLKMPRRILTKMNLKKTMKQIHVVGKNIKLMTQFLSLE